MSRHFNESKPFKEHELINLISKYSHPKIGPFLKELLETTNELPISELYKNIGIDYHKVKTKNFFYRII